MTLIRNILKLLVPAYDMVWNINKYPNLLQKRSFQAEIFYRYIPATIFFVWGFSLVPYVGSFIYILLMLLSLYFVYTDSEKSKKFTNSQYFFIILNIAFLGIRGFIGHTLLSNSVAESIGWETGSYFQIELAFYHLGMAVAGVIYIWKKSLDFALSLVVTKSIFLFGAMGVHLYEVIVNNNLSSGNIGVGIIYGDLVVPAILIYLYIKSIKEKK